jgi:hypothetical protein
MAEGGGINSLNIKLTADPDALKKGLDTAVKALQTGGDKMKQQTEKMTSAMGKWNKTATDVGQTASRQSRALQNLANSYAAMGDAGTAGLRATAAEAIELKRRMEDVQGIIQASDLEGKFKMGAVALGKVTQGVAGAQGAMHMLGISSNTAVETMAKLQSLMAMSQALESIVSLDGEIMALAGSIDLAAARQKILNVVMSPLGIGAIVAGIALAVTAYTLLSEKTYEVSQSMKIRNEIADDTREKLKSEYGESLALVAVLKDETQSRERRNDALKKLQADYPGYLSNVDLEKTKTSDLRAEVQKLTNSIYLQAKAKAAMAKLQDIAAKEIDLEIQRDKELAAVKTASMRFAGESASVVEGATARERAALAATQAELQRVAEQRNEVLRLVKETGAELDKQGNKPAPKSAAAVTPQTSITPPTAKPPVVVPVPETLALARQNIEKVNEELRDITRIELPPIDQAAYQASLDAIAKDQKLEAAMDRKYERVQAQTDALNSGMQSAMAGTVDNISNLISDMFTQPEDAFRNFGNAMLATLGQFMSQLGKAIIAAGTASDVFQKALLANPGAAIAAGAALVIAGAAVTGMMKKGMNARAAQDTGGGGGTPQGIRPFASGGIVSGPTLGLMGEYAGARSNPEVVAPLDKLKSMLGGGTGTLTTRVSGTDLLIMLDRAERNRGRVR